MVLLRRKVVEVQVSDHEPDLDTQVWYIPRTHEYFEDYDSYLTRMDFYNQKKFICELTGHSCLTYFEALDSELRETLQVISSFPEVLKEPILRKVQLSQISRLDALVDFVYNSLKGEFFPGEVAIAKVRDQRIKVIIREKAKFSSITLPNGEVRPPYSRCRVELVANPSQELAVDESQLSRDRKVFTKLILRTFIKHAVARESWNGAPWLVKDEYAQIYRIDQTIPAHLLRSKPAIHEKKKEKPAVSSKGTSTPKRSSASDERGTNDASDVTTSSTPIKRRKKGDRNNNQKNHQRKGNANNSNSSNENGNDEDTNGSVVDKDSHSSSHAHPTKPITKDAIHEDLELQMDPALKRSPLQWEKSLGDSDYHSLIGKLIQVWVFINVYHDPLLVDPFTFDDFLDGLRLSDGTKECSLINEIHCALLSVLVDLDEPELAIPLPSSDEGSKKVNGNGVIKVEHQENNNSHQGKRNSAQENENTKGDNNNSTIGDYKEKNQSNNNDININGKNNNNYDDDDDDNNNENSNNNSYDNDNESTSTPEPAAPNNKVSAFLTYQNSDWKERLRKRMFKEGGWQQILIGVLNSVSYVEEWTDICESALNELASLERPVALFAAYEGYYNLSFEVRTNILCILTSLMAGSNVIRNYMEKCLEETTKLKRERLERQREYRVLQDQIKAIEEEKRQFLNPDKKSSSKDNKTSDSPSVSSSTAVKNEQEGTEEEDNFSDESSKAIPSENDPIFKQYIKDIEALTLKANQLLEQNKDQEDELVRLDCQRLRLLGKDRYYNRYWWFESNGMKRVSILDMNNESTEDEKAEKIEKIEKSEANGFAYRETRQERRQSRQKDNSDGNDNDDDKNDNNDIDGNHEVNEADETPVDYSMGRLWVQGPTDEDLFTFLGWSRELEILKRDNKLGSYVCGFDGRVLIDVYGHPILHMLPMERKRLEEMEMFLTSTDDWGYYDTKKDVDDLIAWLNPFGTRESALRKELLRALPWIRASMKQRQEDLKADMDKRLMDIECRLNEEMQSNEYQDEDGDDNPYSGSPIDKSDDTDELPRRRRSSRLQGESPPPLPISRRRRRTASEGRKLSSTKFCDSEEFARKREQRKEELKEEVFNEISDRVLEWTNTIAIKKLGHSHYETQRKRGPKSRRSRT